MKALKSLYNYYSSKDKGSLLTQRNLEISQDIIKPPNELNNWTKSHKEVRSEVGIKVKRNVSVSDSDQKLHLPFCVLERISK